MEETSALENRSSETMIRDDISPLKLDTIYLFSFGMLKLRGFHKLSEGTISLIKASARQSEKTHLHVHITAVNKTNHRSDRLHHN